MSTGEEPRPGASDLLGDILRLAAREGVLEGAALETFAAALRERAALVIADRIAELDARVQAAERESAWRRETAERMEREVAWRRESAAELESEVVWRRGTMAELEKENAWRRTAMAELEESCRALEREAAWRRETQARQEQESEQLRAARDTADQEHQKLLEHHRDALARLASELAAVACLPVWQRRRARRRLLALVAQLREACP